MFDDERDFYIFSKYFPTPSAKKIQMGKELVYSREDRQTKP